MLCVKYAQDENRYILTKGYETFKMVSGGFGKIKYFHVSSSSTYSVSIQLNGYVSTGYCLKIISDDVDEQIREVLDYYKITVTKDHVFSRCQVSGNFNN